VFSRITGHIVDRFAGGVLVETGGLAYEILLPACVEEKIRATRGEAALTFEIFPHFVLEGNSGRFTFFGFTNVIERQFFEALLSVTSIGPRTAARAFALPMGRIAEAIERGDHGTLVKLPGIGQQKARDIVAKLQGKVTKFLLIRDAPPHDAVARRPDFAEEALLVLLQLEYKRPEAERMIEAALRRSPAALTTEAFLADVYRVLHGDAPPVPVAALDAPPEAGAEPPGAAAPARTAMQRKRTRAPKRVG